MVMTTMHTQKTGRSWSKWPLMLVMLFTLLLEQLMIGTRVFWDQGLLSLLNSETLADMASFCHQIRSSNQEKKYGLPWKLSLSSC